MFINEDNYVYIYIYNYIYIGHIRLGVDDDDHCELQESDMDK